MTSASTILIPISSLTVFAVIVPIWSKPTNISFSYRMTEGLLPIGTKEGVASKPSYIIVIIVVMSLVGVILLGGGAFCIYRLCRSKKDDGEGSSKRKSNQVQNESYLHDGDDPRESNRDTGRRLKDSQNEDEEKSHKSRAASSY